MNFTKFFKLATGSTLTGAAQKFTPPLLLLGSMESRRQPNFWTFSISHPKQCWIVFFGKSRRSIQSKGWWLILRFFTKGMGSLICPKTFKSQKCTPKYEFHSVRSPWLKKTKHGGGGALRPCFHHTPKFGRTMGSKKRSPRCDQLTSHGFEWFD